jgi:hypothetical protein
VADDTPTFVDIRIQAELYKYLELIAQELQTDVGTLVGSLVFDGLAHNMLRNVVESYGRTLDGLVVDFLTHARETEAVDLVDDEDDEENDADAHTDADNHTDEDGTAAGDHAH